MYTIAFDERKRVLHITTEGMWTLANLAAFSAAVLARGVMLKLRYRQFAVLNDVRNFPVQTPDVAKGIEYLMAKGMEISTSPMATVVGSHLSRMQAERVLKADHSRVFMDMDAAVAWLEAEWLAPATSLAA